MSNTSWLPRHCRRVTGSPPSVAVVVGLCARQLQSHATSTTTAYTKPHTHLTATAGSPHHPILQIFHHKQDCFTPCDPKSPKSLVYKDNKQKCFDGEGEGGPGLREPWSRPVDSPRSVGSPGPSGHMVKGGSPTLRPLDSTAFLTEFRMAMVLGDMGLLSQRHQ